MTKSNLLCAAIVLFLTPSVFAQRLPADPHRSWRVLETEHFEIIYDDNQKNLAQNFANEAERAHTLLQPLLKTSVSSKVPLVIADITDSSNGSATGIPRSQIEIYPVLPSVTDSTSEYANWIREVVTHEYTHILNFEPTSGVMGVLRFMFGSILKPGGYLPRWYTEGLAVEMESRLTPVGRGRSHYYSALVRSMVEARTWGNESIDRINITNIPTWPRGERPYTFGFYLMHELSETKNQTGSENNIYGLLDDRYGGRFPWFINGPVKDYFGTGFPGLLTKTYQRLEKTARAQLKTLAAIRKYRPLHQTGYLNRGAQISPDKLKMAAIISDYDDFPGVRVWTRKKIQDPFFLTTEIPKPIVNKKDIHQLAWRADSKHLVYDYNEFWEHFNHYNTYSDLYELDTDTSVDRRLTLGLRAREATVLPDQSLIFVVATPTSTVLMHSDSNGQNPVVIYSPGDGERVSTPRPYRDGVIYSHRDTNGKEWIESFSLLTKKVTVLTRAEKPGQMQIMPISDPQSKEGFYYAGSLTGVMNIYHSDGKLDGEKTAITNSSTYVTSPEVDPSSGSIIFSRLTSNGFEIDSQSLSEKVGKPKEIGPLYNYPSADDSKAPLAKVTEDYSYQGVRYLFPQYFIPFVYFVPGGQVFDLSTAGSDPLYHHQYSATLGWDTRANQPLESLIYTNGSFPFMIDVAFANDYTFLVGGGFTEHFTYASIDTQHFIFPNSNKWTLGPEIIYRMTDYSPFLFTEFGPGVSLHYNGVDPEMDYQISPESGLAFSLAYDYFLSQWGNTSYQNINGMANFYLAGKPLPKHHVMNFKTSAWISPPQQTILTGYKQAGGEYGGSLIATTFLVRGYPVGEFIGSTLLAGNYEYRFPILYPYRGAGTFPLFVEKLHGALVFDAITLDGRYYNTQTNGSSAASTKLGTFYTDVGAEILADLQLFYGFPLTARLGTYYGLNQSAYGGFSYYLGFGIVQ